MASRLTQMQARFQQKQMQEKEEKLLKLYENQQQRAFERVGRGSAGSNTTNGFGTPGGKVRQMFDERRQKAGIDKSYPLEPLKSKSTVRVPNNLSKTVVKTTVKKSVSQIRNGKPVVNQKETIQKTFSNKYRNEEFDDVDSHNNLIDMMNNHNLGGNLDDEEMPRIGFNDDLLEKTSYMTGKLSNLGGKLPSQMIETKPKTNGLSQRNNITQKDVTSKKPVAKTTPSRASSGISSANSTSSLSSRNSPARSETNMSSKSPPTAPQRAPTNNRPSSKQTPKSPVVRDDLAECRYCGRRFATDRLGTHEDICAKAGKKKRKTYDATKHRVIGTELESYVGKSGKKGAGSKAASKHSTAPKTNWRRTHEEFIAAIRAAKQAQAHVAKGGKLSDLPPPPPSSNPDYVQCPHCGRRFNEAAAQRHIPKCASYEFNKPKPGAPPKARPGKR